MDPSKVLLVKNFTTYTIEYQPEMSFLHLYALHEMLNAADDFFENCKNVRNLQARTT